MAQEVLHMKVGSLLGEHLLDIAQTNISNGNVEYGANVYKMAFPGFTDELTMKVLKNQLVVITNEDGTSICLSDDPKDIENNAHNLLDWELIINKRINNLLNIEKSIRLTEKDFRRYYTGDIEDYDINEMMHRYFDDEQLSVIGIHNIAARIIDSEDCTVCDKGNSNPASVWERLEGKFEGYDDIDDADASKYEKILYITVRYHKLIRMLHNEYMKFENLYFFLIENGFAERPSMMESNLERVVDLLYQFTNLTKGYNHPLCNEGLENYKKTLYDDLFHKTRIGKEYIINGIIKKNILDGYDGGWLSPDGEFYGENGETSSMIHMRIAEQIFNHPTNKYSIMMVKDGVSIWGDTNSPDYWLEKHGWVKIHHNDCYGSFIGHRNEAPTKDFPYSYNPTDIQVKMICNYADKFYGGKFYTEPNAMGRLTQNEPFTTYAVRQMDEFGIHNVFSR